MKNLETEYKKQIADEVPDLWSRIESSIDAIEGQNEKDNNVVEFKTPENTSGSRIKKINSILKYSAIVASAACVLVVVLAVTRSGKDMSAAAPMSESAAYDTDSAAANESYYEESAEAEDAEETRSSKDRKKKKDVLNFSSNEAAASAEAMTDSAPMMTEEAVTEAAETEPEMDANAGLTYDGAIGLDETANGLTGSSKAGANEEGSNKEEITEAEYVTVNGRIIDSETVEYKGKSIFYITVIDSKDNTYRIFVPEEKEEEVRDHIKDGWELTFTLSIITGGNYNADYVYESAE
ncbi:MAG: hypothetical protein K5870_03670 [Lachnospiraceae bacterium]|nr:hypothetical protein [Lachnospiraceae bacterium]